MSWMNKGLG
uniref:Protein CASP isoform X2 n=1 Tax=Rhizophora mucronata TaxID=61149 RepID=A0A2P2IN91_RHIMU